MGAQLSREIKWGEPCNGLPVRQFAIERGSYSARFTVEAALKLLHTKRVLHNAKSMMICPLCGRLTPSDNILFRHIVNAFSEIVPYEQLEVAAAETVVRHAALCGEIITAVGDSVVHMPVSPVGEDKLHLILRDKVIEDSDEFVSVLQHARLLFRLTKVSDDVLAGGIRASSVVQEAAVEDGTLLLVHNVNDLLALLKLLFPYSEAAAHYKCPECGDEFASWASLRGHIQSRGYLSSATLATCFLYVLSLCAQKKKTYATDGRGKSVRISVHVVQ